MTRDRAPWCKGSLLLALLWGAALVRMVFFSGSSSESVHGKPAGPEQAPPPRLAAPAPMYSDVVPALNPTRLYLQDDGHKVLGWVSGGQDWRGRAVTIRSNTNVGERTEQLTIGPGNLFTWNYQP